MHCQVSSATSYSGRRKDQSIGQAERIFAGALAGVVLIPSTAAAEIKWFAPYDVTTALESDRWAFSPHLVSVLIGCSLLPFAGLLLHRFFKARHLSRVAIDLPQIADVLFRAAVGGFCIALFATEGLILRPEMHIVADWPNWLELGIAISLLSRRACVLGGLGVLALYWHGIMLYGLIYMLGYLEFAGIAGYLILTSTNSQRLRSLRIPILAGSIIIALVSAAIAGWVYPQQPFLGVGAVPVQLMVTASFVEFSLAFYFMTAGVVITPGYNASPAPDQG